MAQDRFDFLRTKFQTLPDVVDEPAEPNDSEAAGKRKRKTDSNGASRTKHRKTKESGASASSKQTKNQRKKVKDEESDEYDVDVSDDDEDHHMLQRQPEVDYFPPAPNVPIKDVSNVKIEDQNLIQPPFPITASTNHPVIVPKQQRTDEDDYDDYNQ